MKFFILGLLGVFALYFIYEGVMDIRSGKTELHAPIMNWTKTIKNRPLAIAMGILKIVSAFLLLAMVVLGFVLSE